MDPITIFLILFFVLGLYYMFRKQLIGRREAAHPDSVSQFGNLLFDEMVLNKRIQLFDKGYVRIGNALGALGEHEKLVSIQTSTDASKKTAIGRGVVAVATFGANLALSNQRGDMYLVMMTDKTTHSFHKSPPSDGEMKRLFKLDLTANTILQQLNPVESVAQVTSGTNDIAESLSKLQQLKDSGALSDSEFQKAKAKLLDI